MDNQIQAGGLLYQIDDRESYQKTYPVIEGKGKDGALHEIHIFLMPLNPVPEVVEKAKQLTQQYNELRKDKLVDGTMKMCFLTLVFREPGPISVLQSARYFRSNDQDEVIKEAYIDCEHFRQNGYDVVRVKIEANAHSNKGIPGTADQAQLFPKYFEHHVKVEHESKQGDAVITKQETETLLKVSSSFTQEFKTPVPSSWNNLGNVGNLENPGYQRFLNLRFREMGIKQINEKLDLVYQEIDTKTCFRVVQSIDEYVWYDTYTNMDHGWIDFSPQELKVVLSA